MKKLLISALIVLSLTGCGGTTEARTVRVAAAADLTFAMAEISALVAEVDPSINVAPAFGSSGQFLQQILNGAPFDLYLSADRAFPSEVADQGFADPTDIFEYGVGRLVVWTTRAEFGQPTLQTLGDPAVRTVSIANPRHAPYGRAADAAIVNAGLAEAVASKLVLGENVSQAAEFVLSGSADVGVVALALVLADATKEAGSWTLVPSDLHAPITQAGVVLQRAQDVEAARVVRDVIMSPAGQDILRRYGFEPVSP
jgi:molybdate transport system substrate-binding protein